MADALSERELRKIIRDRARERMLQEEQQKKEQKERQRLEELERTENELLRLQLVANDYAEDPDTELNQPTEHKSDIESDLSDLDTIDDYLHDLTRRDIQELQTPYKTSSIQSQRNAKDTTESHFAFIDEYIERLNVTLGEIREDRSHVSKENDIRGDKSNYEWKVAKRSRERDMKGNQGNNNREIKAERNDDENSTYKSYEMQERSHGRSVKESPRRKILTSEHSIRDKKIQLEKVRIEKEEMMSQSSRYERESLKIRKLQHEEEVRQALFKENERKLQEEIESKRKAEQELLERIELLHYDEDKLNRKRNENEMLERQMSIERKENETLDMKIRLLKEKEKLLKERIESREKEIDRQEEYKKGSRIDDNKSKTEKMKLIKPSPDCKQEQLDRSKVTIQESCIENTHKTEEYPLFKVGQPKIPTFNGKHFEQWKLEVTCLIRTGMYPDYAIVQAMRNSLIGETRQVLLTLKPTASAEEIITKLNDIYGDIKTGDKIVQNFYSATQKEGEPSSVWGVRIETLFQRAVEKGEIDESKRDSKLKERFWRGLRSDKLKMATRVSYESKDTFEKLRRKTRLEEEEEKKSIEEEKQKPIDAYINQQKETDEKLTLLQELLDRLKTIENDVGKLKSETRRSNIRGGYNQRRPYYGGYRWRNKGPTRNETNLKENNGTNEKEKASKKGHLNEKGLPSEGSMEAKK